MRTPEQIKKKISKLERRLKLLHKYRDEINYDVSNISVSSSTYDEYTRDIEYVRGKLNGIKWLLDQEGWMLKIGNNWGVFNEYS